MPIILSRPYETPQPLRRRRRPKNRTATIGTTGTGMTGVTGTYDRTGMMTRAIDGIRLLLMGRRNRTDGRDCITTGANRNRPMTSSPRPRRNRRNRPKRPPVDAGGWASRSAIPHAFSVVAIIAKPRHAQLQHRPRPLRRENQSRLTPKSRHLPNQITWRCSEARPTRAPRPSRPSPKFRVDRRPRARLSPFTGTIDRAARNPGGEPPKAGVRQ